jgi:hypothetical protein
MAEVEYCPTDCWPKKKIEQMDVKLDLIHDWVVVRKDREQQSDLTWARIKDKATIISAAVAFVTAVAAVFIWLRG